MSSRFRGHASAVGVPFVDFARIHAPLRDEISRSIARVVENGDFVMGRAIDDFEQAFATYVGSASAVGVASGTAALELAVQALGIGPGEEVVIPANTFAASAFGPMNAGAKPVFCDVSPETGLIDPDAAADAVGARTAAIMPVHLYGRACDMTAIQELASRHGLAVIEDAAQAHGASWDGRLCGSIGDVGCFSFYPSKNLGAFGDGGMIATSDSQVASRARALRNLGQEVKGEHQLLGRNERLDTIQAAVLSAKLPTLDEDNRSRMEAAGWYQERLVGKVGVRPDAVEGADVFHLFPIRTSSRPALERALADAQVGFGIHYSPPVHLQPVFGGAIPRGQFPNAEAWANQELSLPIFPGLTEDEVDYVCQVVTRT